MALTKVRTNEQVGDITRGVGPTLILGLGGTGKDVLLRLRRLLVEHYGALDHLPFIRFLHMDTDQTQEAKEQYDIKALDDPLYERIAFSRNELVDLHILGGTGQIMDNIDRYEHIRDWFQVKGRMANLGDLGKGAGQIRMASRLAFYLKAGEIKDHIQRIAGELMQANVIERAQDHGFAVDPRIRDIYVVGSLAGGTGSGIFLDVGFLLKQTMDSFSRSGVFLLPSVFSGLTGENRMKANGYAALMELNHYSFGNSFLCQWGQTEKRSLAPPPYDTTYLIDSENGAGVMALPNDLYQMIAESLYHEFSLGSFSDKKRSVRVNLIQFTQNAYIDHFWEGFEGIGGATHANMLGDAYTLRFSSFGLSAILLPVDKILGACACRLGREIIDLWQQQAFQGLLEDLYTRFLYREDIRFAQGDIDLRDGNRFTAKQLEEELLWQNKGAGITYEQYFRTKIQTLMGELRAAPMKRKSERLQRFMLDVESWFGREDSDRDEEWGQVSRHIASNAEEYLKQLKKAIREECDRLANAPRYGIAYVLALLRELKKAINSELENIWYVSHFENELKNWTDSTTYYKSELDVVAQELHEHEWSFLFRGDNVKRDLLLLCGDNGEDRGLIDNWLYSRLHRLKARWGKTICEAIDDFLGKDNVNGSGLIAEHRKLLQFLDEFKDRLGRLHDYFKREQPYSIYKNLLAPGDIEYWYNIWVGGDAERPNFTSRLTEFSNDILAHVFESDSVTAALSMIRVSTSGEIENRIMNRCKHLLKERPEQPSALRALFQNRMEDRTREQIVTQAFNQAKAQLHPPTDLGHVVYARPSANQSPYYIGLDTTDPYASQLEAILRKVVPAGDRWTTVSLGADNKGAIVFFNELSGVPAFYPRSVNAVNGLREWYRTYFTDPQKMDPNNKEVLHTHKNRFLFNDIIPKTREQQERYRYAVRSFVLGRLLDVMRTTERRDGILFSYEDDSVAWRPLIVDLGLGENEAIDFLYQRDQSPPDGAVYLKMNRKIEYVVDRLQSSGLLIVYILLLEFYQKTIYVPENINELDGLALAKYSPQYAAIAQELKRIAKRCADARLDNALSEARAKLTGGRKELSPDEYVEILRPYCRVEGTWTERTESAIGGEQMVSRKALVLDLEGFKRWLSRQSGGQLPQSGPHREEPQQGAAQGPRQAASQDPTQGPDPGATEDGFAFGSMGTENSGPSSQDFSGAGDGGTPGDQNPGWGADYGWSTRGPEQTSAGSGPAPGGAGSFVGQEDASSRWGSDYGRQSENASSGWRSDHGGQSEDAWSASAGRESFFGKTGWNEETVTCPRCNQRVPKAAKCANCQTVLHI